MTAALSLALAVALILFTFPVSLSAYIDPGAGSYVYWRALTAALRRRGRRPADRGGHCARDAME
jgi:hypothetical protein